METFIAILIALAFFAAVAFIAYRIKKSNNKSTGVTKTGTGGTYPNKPNYNKVKRPSKE
jgi:hypothetical protein